MPRLSLYRPEKGNDFKFLDKVIHEQFQVGGTDIFIHKYLGPQDPTEGNSSPGTPVQNNPISELGIQDVILMENRDRRYDPNVYVMRTIYTMQDLDFNLSQFGIFLNNDNIFLHLHLRGCVDTIGRKIMSGDVVELPHLKDEYALDDTLVSLKRFYVVQDVTRAANGFSQTWYPHLLRLKCVPMVDSQEYADILNGDAGAGDGSTLRDILSTYNKNIEINNSIIAQAELDAPNSGYDTNNLYVVPSNNTVNAELLDASLDTQLGDASWDYDATGAIESTTAPESPVAGTKWLNTTDPDNPILKVWNGHFWQGNVIDASMVLQSPNREFYVGYLTGDGRPPNGAPYTFGIAFPTSGIVEGQFHLRTDYFPNRLFRFNGQNWMRFEDNVRMTMTNRGTAGEDNTDNTLPQTEVKSRKTQRTGFVNNASTATIGGKVVVERQALSKALRPKADN